MLFRARTPSASSRPIPEVMAAEPSLTPAADPAPPLRVLASDAGLRGPFFRFDGRAAALVLAFVSPHVEFEAVVRGLRRLAGAVPLVAVSTAGELCADGSGAALRPVLPPDRGILVERGGAGLFPRAAGRRRAAVPARCARHSGADPDRRAVVVRELSDGGGLSQRPFPLPVHRRFDQLYRIPVAGFSTFGELFGIDVNQTLTALFFFPVPPGGPIRSSMPFRSIIPASPAISPAPGWPGCRSSTNCARG